MRARFGDCTLDTTSRELIRGGERAHLTGKAFRLLEVLIERRPTALSKDELQDLVWPGVFVSEANITSLITELRKAIGDDAHGPAFIRTVYGFGYAFSGDVEEVAPPAAKKRPAALHRLIWGRKEIELAEGGNILGRGPESLVWIDRDTVSRRHAQIVIAGERATIEDLGSKNGTFLNAKRLSAPADLKDGDEIRVGSVPVAYRMLRDAASTATSARPRRR